MPPRNSYVIGIGVDMLQLSRLQALLHRQSIRLATGNPASYPEFLLSGVTHAEPPYTIAAASKLAQKICSPHELEMFLKLLYGGEIDKDGKPRVGARPPKPHDRVVKPSVLRWLALRWTAKEAAFKALQPYLPLRWGDVQVMKFVAESSPGRLARFQLSEGGTVASDRHSWALQDRALGKPLKRSQLAATPKFPADQDSSGDDATSEADAATTQISDPQEPLDPIAQRALEDEQLGPPKLRPVDESQKSTNGKPFLQFTPLFHRRWREAREIARQVQGGRDSDATPPSTSNDDSLEIGTDLGETHDQRIDLHLSATHDAGLVFAQVTAQLVPHKAPQPWHLNVLRHVRF